jgi:DNA-binding transcriptional LysR family regulator
LNSSTEMIAVLPDSIARDYAAIGWLCILPVKIALQLEPYGIITRKERFPDPAVNTFQECLRTLATEGRARLRRWSGVGTLLCPAYAPATKGPNRA